MTVLLNPYMMFESTAREAMEFYHSVFGGDLTVTTFGESGATEPDLADKVMHAMLTTGNGLALMASDSAPGMPSPTGSTINISLSGDDPVLRDYWSKLADGGTVTVPLEKQMWGDEFGQLTDRFGISWLVNIGQPQS